MWNILYMDMFKSGANNTPETLTAVGGGGAKSPLLASYKPVLWIEQNCEVSL